MVKLITDRRDNFNYVTGLKNCFFTLKIVNGFIVHKKVYKSGDFSTFVEQLRGEDWKS